MDKLQQSLNAYRGRRVMLTGHTGFKGTWMALWLANVGAKLLGYSTPAPTDPSHYEASRVSELLVDEAIADIRDRQRLEQSVREFEPEIIFHMAAQPLVRLSYEQPYETFEVNAMGTANLLEVVRQSNLNVAVVVITTDKCYDNVEQVWGYRENDPLGGSDPYSASKAAAELVVHSYRNSFFTKRSSPSCGVRLASVRAGNVIGGGDWSRDRIVTDAIAHLVQGLPIPIRNPRAIRPWQHVLEPLSGYLQLGAKLLTSEDPKWCSAWNFGPTAGDTIPVGNLVDRLCQAWGSGSWKNTGRPDQLHEAQALRLSIDKATAVLGWSPRWSVATTVERTVGWYRQFHQAAGNDTIPDMRAVSLADIEAFESTEVPRDDSQPSETTGEERLAEAVSS